MNKKILWIFSDLLFYMVDTSSSKCIVRYLKYILDSMGINYICVPEDVKK